MFRISPQIAAAASAVRVRRHNQRYYHEAGISEVGRKVAEHGGLKVQSGPFREMRLPPALLREHLAPYLLGCYEHELHVEIERMISLRPSCLVDIGAKFGYYAVGMAMRVPGIRLIAFDTDPWARRMIRDTAKLNDVRIEVMSFCSRSWLSQELPERSFVISDCEGYEATLFSEPLAGGALSSHFLVETHDHEVEGATAKVKSSLDAHHEVREIFQEHVPCAVPFLTEKEAEIAVSDLRPSGQRWLYAEPKLP